MGRLELAGKLSSFRFVARCVRELLDTSEAFFRVDDEFTSWISFQQLGVKLDSVLPVAQVFLALASLDQSSAIPFFESVVRVRFGVRCDGIFVLVLVKERFADSPLSDRCGFRSRSIV